MEMVQELIPLAKELMAQKPSAKLVRMYLLGGVLALFGAVLGLMEAVCGPFREATLAELGEPAPRDQGKPLEGREERPRRGASEPGPKGQARVGVLCCLNLLLRSHRLLELNYHADPPNGAWD
uniref:Uncharacterized protein n=1 Tax=Ovis aries TaxID=9940 RepID=A0AC11C806_SHEEP